jgi:phosphinothricin acetyltransferase
MKMSKIIIRKDKEEDAERLLEIYAPYVIDTAITFEYEVPTVDEFRQRINNTLKKYPYLVAEDEKGNLMGYSYAGAFKGRAAYDWAVETSIYVKQGEAGKGLGRLLHDALQKELQQMGILNMCACISAPRGTDPYLTDNSIQFHSHLGYRMVGRFMQCGYKFSRWYDMVWMEKHIGEHTETVEPVFKKPAVKKAAAKAE